MGRLHAPNEFLRIRRLRERMRAWEELWRLLAGLSRWPITSTPTA